MITVIDTFKDFKNCFENSLDLSIKEKIDIWENCYMSKYPKLRKKCIEDYELEGYNWHEIAKNKVFNRTSNDFSKMLEAHNNIIEILEEINGKSVNVFNITLDINIILYSGLCNSAGWVDKYEGKRAILYGIDQIARLNWHNKEQLEPLLAHELCHVLHFQLRGEDKLPNNVEKNKYNQGIWNIYEEGFAQFYQNKLLGKDSDSRGQKWIEECKSKEQELKALYYDALYDEEKGTNDFFGDWFKILEISDTGYYLGSQLVRDLSNKNSVTEIAQMSFETIKAKVIEYLNG